MDGDFSVLTFVTLTFLLAGFIKGIIGLGLPTVAIGAVLMIYAVVGLTAVRFSVSTSAERWLAPLIGIVTGVVSAASGVFGIPAVGYLQALELSKEDLVQALGISFTVSAIALAA